MSFVKAECTDLYLRCALFGPSGSGKTMTAMRIAKGLSERLGCKEFAVIDTEARSASKYANRFNFVVDNLNDKTIDQYIKSMGDCAKAGIKVLVIDSLSHAWRELTEEVDRIAQKSMSGNSFSAWGRVSPKQKRFIDAILNFPGHIIATMRSKTEWVITESDKGKKVPEKVGLAPEQGKGIEYEFDMLLELSQNHTATVTKDRTGKFQDAVIEKPGEDFGEALYDWITDTAGNTPAAKVLPINPAKTARKPAKTKTVEAIPPQNVPPRDEIKARREELISAIGGVMTSDSQAGTPAFSESEKEQTRQLIKSASLDEKGNADLVELRDFLADELSKRQTKAA